jgi:hypothetical protein
LNQDTRAVLWSLAVMVLQSLVMCGVVALVLTMFG